MRAASDRRSVSLLGVRMSTAAHTAAAPVPRLQLSLLVPWRAHCSLVATRGARVPAVAAALRSVRAGSASAAIVQRRRCAFAVGAAHNPSVERTANGGLRLLALPKPAAPSSAAHLERYAPAMQLTGSLGSLDFLGGEGAQPGDDVGVLSDAGSVLGEGGVAYVVT